MKLGIGFAIVFLAAVNVAPAQPQQGQLNSQAAAKKAVYQKSADLARQQYFTCIANSSTSGEPPNCQSYINDAAYYDAMGAAVTNSGDVPAATAQKLALQRTVANTKFNYTRSAQIARQQYSTCMTNNSTSSVPPNCQSFLDAAAFYEGMAAAVTDSGVVPAATQQKLTLQRNNADTKFKYQRSAQIAQQQYEACLKNPNAAASTCQNFLKSEQAYVALAAGFPDPLPK